MKRHLFDCLILSLVLGATFTMGYVFTTASMILLYAFVYAMVDTTN
ncbi:MAG: hypothetical protein ACK40G_00330 [Cytophagaceae bacterium]